MRPVRKPAVVLRRRARGEGGAIEAALEGGVRLGSVEGEVRRAAVAEAARACGDDDVRRGGVHRPRAALRRRVRHAAREGADAEDVRALPEVSVVLRRRAGGERRVVEAALEGAAREAGGEGEAGAGARHHVVRAGGDRRLRRRGARIRRPGVAAGVAGGAGVRALAPVRRLDGGPAARPEGQRRGQEDTPSSVQNGFHRAAPYRAGCSVCDVRFHFRGTGPEGRRALRLPASAGGAGATFAPRGTPPPALATRAVRPGGGVGSLRVRVRKKDAVAQLRSTRSDNPQ